MLSDRPGVDVGGVYRQLAGEALAQPPGVERRARAEDADTTAAETASQVLGDRIHRIGHDDHHPRQRFLEGVGHGAGHLEVLVEHLHARGAGRVASPRRQDREVGRRRLGERPALDPRSGEQRQAVLEVERFAAGAIGVPVVEHEPIGDPGLQDRPGAGHAHGARADHRHLRHAVPRARARAARRGTPSTRLPSRPSIESAVQSELRTASCTTSPAASKSSRSWGESSRRA